MKAAADMSPRFMFKWRSGRIWGYGSALPDGKKNMFLIVVLRYFLHYACFNLLLS